MTRRPAIGSISCAHCLREVVLTDGKPVHADGRPYPCSVADDVAIAGTGSAAGKGHPAPVEGPGRSREGGPVPIEEASTRCVDALERKGLVASEVEEVHITAKGKAIAAALNGKGTRAAVAPAKPAARKANGHMLTDAEYHRVRAEIEARYQADLSALDRVHAILQTIAGDGQQ